MILSKIQEFEEKEVKEVYSECIMAAKQTLVENENEWKQQFLHSFKETMKNALIIQKEDFLDATYCILQLRRVEIVQHRYLYHVTFYDDNWYLYDGIEVGCISFGFLYEYFEKMWQQLSERKKSYIGMITDADIKYIMMDKVQDFHELAVDFMRKCLIDLLEIPEYQELEKLPRFCIQSGEFYDLCDYIHIECKDKDYDALRKWLSKEEQGECYWFEDFRQIELNEMQLEGIDLRYADFRGSTLNSVVFRRCYLKGTKFRESTFYNVRFENCDMEDIDLADCDAENYMIANM